MPLNRNSKSSVSFSLSFSPTCQSNSITAVALVDLSSPVSSCPGGPERGGDHPDHSPSAQGASPLPAAQTEEGGGVSAAREGQTQTNNSYNKHNNIQHIHLGIQFLGKYFSIPLCR